MAAGEQVAFEPAFALMLAQHLHHTAVGRDVIVGWKDLGGRTPIRYLEHRVPPVRIRFVRAEDAEVVAIRFDHVADERP